MQKQENIQAYILAGGMSSRMGTEKGLVKLNGESFIQRILSQLNNVFQNVSINSSNTQYKSFGVPLVIDIIPQCGPLSGIHACLSNCKKPHAFIISCDVPLIRSESIHKFLNERNEKFPIQVLEYKNQIEPLFGIYSTSLLPEIEKRLKKKDWSVLNFVQESSHQRINLNNISENPEEEWININSPQELLQTEKKLTWVK